ncbi:Xaa-Pro peptidase family protein [Patescibacteria group bacterium]|nr:Xaa-Pro peptidase family protein [Patescibacteria group bacterium]MBU1472474.1 Xaa-Pro peptidase family protein [Patescibacteria group bacterium]MBU2460288.1 Xaa-Pro peptidase family protein [Patescibacteria group bacterium]MBU2543854.1 Xaa-Pro peptidase family protein [Patescibacteria group bacterium]
MLTVLRDLNGLFITNPVNIRYLTGFVGAATEERESYLLITSHKAYLFTNGLYLEQAKNLELLNCYIVKLLKTKNPLEIVEISRENPISKELAELTKKLGIKKLGFESADLTVAECQKLKQTLKGVALIPTKNRIEKLRMIKREDEVDNIRQAAKVTDACFDFILPRLTPGVEEGEIAWEIETFLSRPGLDRVATAGHTVTMAFSPIVAFGKNTSQPHYLTRPGLKEDQGRALRLNDVVLLDFGARVNGYCADMTRAVFIGEPKQEWIRAYDTVMEAQKSAFEYLASCSRPGLGAQADRIAAYVLRKAGFTPYPHGLGHGIGLDVHENPRLNMKKNEQLLPGMVFSVEPGVYIPGNYGIRIEDLVLLKQSGIEILSKTTKKMIII